MEMNVSQIAELVGGKLYGNGAIVLNSVANLTTAGPNDLTYAEEKFHARVPETRAGCVIVGAGSFPDQTVVVVRNPKLAFARAANLLLKPPEEPREVHSTAIIAEDVAIGKNVKVGAGAVIEPGASIADGTIIEAGCYVGRRSRIGQDCTIYPNVVIYADAAIGNRVIIHSGCVIGADGFGFVRSSSGYVKFPQAGWVIIEDDVEIGANTCVDRGSLEVTIIRRGVKLDNLVQVAHNVEIGEDTVIAAQTGISGSCTIGAQSIIGGQVGIGEHARLNPGTVLGGQAGVLNSKHVKTREVLWGTPARPLKEFLTQEAYVARLPAMHEELQKLRLELEALKKSQ